MVAALDAQVRLMSTALVLLLATGIVVPCAVAVFVRDLRMAPEAHERPATSRVRAAVEAALPLVGVVLLLGLTWAAL